MSAPGPKPSTVTATKGVTWKTILIIALLIASLSLLAALPLSFFFNGGMGSGFGNWFGNVPLGLMPEPGQIPQPPETLPINLSDFQIPEGEQMSDWLQNYLNNLPNGTPIPESLQDYMDSLPGTLPENLTGSLPPGDIPLWVGAGALAYLLGGGQLPGGGGVGEGGSDGVGGLPGMGGSMGTGLGPFGTPGIYLWASGDLPFRYWRIRAYDYFFDGKTWVIGDNSTTIYPGYSASGANYTVIMTQNYTRAGYKATALPLLWNQPLIHSDLQVFNETWDPVNMTWDLIKDEYGSVFLNATFDIPGLYYLEYTVTCNDSVNVPGIESNVYSASPLTFTADPPGPQNYLQLPNLSAYPLVQTDIQNLISNPALTSKNTYQTAQAVMEYFKTRWWWTPFRAQTPGRDFDPNFLIVNGFGNSADFASNYVTYLRAMNISARLVWGGFGFQNDNWMSMFKGIPLSRITHSHFWAEVWIPNAANNGGEWVQFDPSPLPPTMWQPDLNNPTGPLIEIDIRRNDTRIETSHYTMLFDASVAYDIPQDRSVDMFNLTGNLLRDGKTLTTTWLNEAVKYNYSEVTENLFLGTRDGMYDNYTFPINSRVGLHRFNAAFYAVQNETRVTCNGTTQVFIESLTPSQLNRGDSFTVTANITDALNGQPIADVDLRGYLVDLGYYFTEIHMTDITGHVQAQHRFPNNVLAGSYDFQKRFNGTFWADYPEPYPDYNVTIINGASISQTIPILVIATLNISLTVSSSFGAILPPGYDISFNGFLFYDTSIPNNLVTIWWKNSTGTYNISADYTDALGYYQTNYKVPNNYKDLAGGNNVYIFANASTIYGSCTSNRTAIYFVRCSNTTSLTLSLNKGAKSYIIRQIDTIQVSGRLWDPQGVASTANQRIEIRIVETDEQLGSSLLTDINGYFQGSITFPNTKYRGIYRLYAKFDGTWRSLPGSAYIASSASSSTINSSHEVMVVARTFLTKNANLYDIGRNVQPEIMIAGDPIIISGYLLFDNGTGYGSCQVKAWWIRDSSIKSIGTAITASAGNYLITYNIPQEEPVGDVVIKVNFSAGALVNSYILNASTDADPEVYWSVNITINELTPSAALRGVTLLTISGYVVEKYGKIIANEQVDIKFNNTPVLDKSNEQVYAKTNAMGYFSKDFTVSGNYPIAESYVVIAKPTNSSFIPNYKQNASVEVNTTTKILDFAIDRTILIGEFLNIRGQLLDNNDQNQNGTVSLWIDGTYLNQTIVDGAFSWDCQIPNNPSYTGIHTLTLQYDGTDLTYPSSAQLLEDIPIEPKISLTNIAGFTTSQNITLNTGSQITVMGVLQDNESGIPIINHQVDLYYNGTIFGTGTTDSSGLFYIEITVPNYVGTTTILVRLKAININTSDEITVYTILPPNLGEMFMQYLPWIIAAIVGVIVLYLSYSYVAKRERRKKEKRVKFEGINLEFIKNKLAALQQGNRFREAIIYSYYNYLQLVQGAYNIQRHPSQTAREFAMDMVKKVKIPPALIYPFTTFYEEARFGRQEMTANTYNEAFKLFEQLNNLIMGGPKEVVKEPASTA